LTGNAERPDPLTRGHRQLSESRAPLWSATRIGCRRDGGRRRAPPAVAGELPRDAVVERALLPAVARRLGPGCRGGPAPTESNRADAELSGRGLPGVIPGWARSGGGRVGDVTGPRRAGPVPGVG